MQRKQSGQILLTLLVFMIVAITITAGAAAVLLNSITSGSRYEQGDMAYFLAETGIENALLRILRNPNYTGETLTTSDGSVITEVTPGNPVTIQATATVGSSTRKIEVQIVYNNNIFTLTSWKEIY